MTLAILFVFLCGIANFAMHRAVLESRHPLLGQAQWLARRAGGGVTYGLEFLLLLGAMLMVGDGSSGWALGYGVYTLLNAGSAWLILTGRV